MGGGWAEARGAGDVGLGQHPHPQRRRHEYQCQRLGDLLPPALKAAAAALKASADATVVLYAVVKMAVMVRLEVMVTQQDASAQWDMVEEESEAQVAPARESESQHSCPAAPAWLECPGSGSHGWLRLVT
eukprot:732111-Prymnesium_polylepis.1